MSVVVVVEGEGWRMSYLFRGRQSAPTGEQRAVRLPAELMARMTGSSNVVAVDPDSAMRHDAVWSCRTRIAQDVSMMPVDVVRYTATGRQAVVPVVCRQRRRPLRGRVRQRVWRPVHVHRRQTTQGHPAA